MEVSSILFPKISLDVIRLRVSVCGLDVKNLIFYKIFSIIILEKRKKKNLRLDVKLCLQLSLIYVNIYM